MQRNAGRAATARIAPKGPYTETLSALRSPNDGRSERPTPSVCEQAKLEVELDKAKTLSVSERERVEAA